MARIKIEDLDHKVELDDMDLDRVIGGGSAYGAVTSVNDLLPSDAFPALGSGSLGL
ncbi:MAG: hypothetical protein AAGD13_24165 [Pseudomonadota bacterium]